ncbi:hypothetical protein COLO4_15626 [Corchorus olitorius]|uniref:Uncharacterized protein n=1 Tax=Corchorus olitorius TaxID=93759 RepID=A0A1R3JLZ5_9ROSI|nr:hypothetical protein COLO4_15626 [Corchorus olitorius]
MHKRGNCLPSFTRAVGVSFIISTWRDLFRFVYVLRIRLHKQRVPLPTKILRAFANF